MKAWIGVDLDGTLAEYHGRIDTIGAPIPLMMDRVKRWLKAGKTVKIMTARAADRNQVRMIQAWLVKNGLPKLAVTNKKDFAMIALWDDRAVEVETNTGKPAMWIHNAS